MTGLVREMMQAGLYLTQAQAISGATGVASTGLTAAGTTQGTALALTSQISSFIVTTAAASSGVVLATGYSLGDEVIGSNQGANACAVYCPSGGTMNGVSNGSHSLAVGKGAAFRCTSKDGLTWLSYGG